MLPPELDSVRGWGKWLVLLVTVLTLAVAVWKAGFQPSILPQREGGVIGDSTIKAEDFHYTELQRGTPIYHLTGQKMQDGAGQIGALRVAAMRVVKIEKVQLALLQPKVAGWLLTTAHGQWVAGNRQLSLWGNVRGKKKGGGSLRAGRIMVSPRMGRVELQDGFVLDVGSRHARGIAMELGR